MRADDPARVVASGIAHAWALAVADPSSEARFVIFPRRIPEERVAVQLVGVSLSASGEPGEEFVVGARPRFHPAAAAAISGDRLLVAWLQDHEIARRVFDSSGRAITPEVTVAKPGGAVDDNVNVTVIEDGFLLTWRRRIAGEARFEGLVVDRSGRAVGEHSPLPPGGGFKLLVEPGSGRAIRLALDGSGEQRRLRAFWIDSGQKPHEIDIATPAPTAWVGTACGRAACYAAWWNRAAGIELQIFDETGAVGPLRQLEAPREKRHLQVWLAAVGSRSVAFAWREESDEPSASASWHLRLVDLDGKPKGPAVLLDAAAPSGSIGYASLAANDDGFLVTWVKGGTVFARQFPES